MANPILTVAVVSVALVACRGPAPHSAHWGYGADDGPAAWAGLSSDYEACGSGHEQSPIDLRDAREDEHPPLETDYRPVALHVVRHEHVVDIIDNGHTIQVNYREGSTLRVSGEVFELAQYHFHAPSEHTLDGRHAPMEMHLVHRSADGAFLVVGVLVEEGAHNAAFEPIFTHLPREPGERRHLEQVQVDIDDLVPADLRAYRYPGSLTTPPCREGVQWAVLVAPIELSREQIRAFTSIIPANNRPVQPLGGRAVTLAPGPD